MRSDIPNNLILNGFDRSGSSAISRVLAQHPQIELIFQPFNSGPIRRVMYRIMDDSMAGPADYAFFNALAEGRLEADYIVSPWHEKYSTVKSFERNKLHVIKTTLNHLTMEWVTRHFPTLELWGIWRDPEAILASLQRNDFFGKHYADALDAIRPTVLESPLLQPIFGELIQQIKSECQATAFLVGVRSYYFFFHLEPAKLMIYERFLEDANRELNRICSYFELDPFDFSRYTQRDWNVSGERYTGPPAAEIQGADLSFARRVFAPLLELCDDRMIGTSAS